MSQELPEVPFAVLVLTLKILLVLLQTTMGGGFNQGATSMSEHELHATAC